MGDVPATDAELPLAPQVPSAPVVTPVRDSPDALLVSAPERCPGRSIIPPLLVTAIICGVEV